MITNPPVPYDFCVGDPISHLLTVVAAFNQEKAPVGAFSVIVKTGFGTDGPICGTKHNTGTGISIR